MGGPRFCLTAIRVGATYNTCITDVKALDCSAVPSSSWLPAACSGVILKTKGFGGGSEWVFEIEE